jgi:hypothetical protein
MDIKQPDPKAQIKAKDILFTLVGAEDGTITASVNEPAKSIYDRFKANDTSKYQLSAKLLLKIITFIKTTEHIFIKETLDMLKKFFGNTNALIDKIKNAIANDKYEIQDIEMIGYVSGVDTEAGLFTFSYIEEYYYNKIADGDERLSAVLLMKNGNKRSADYVKEEKNIKEIRTNYDRFRYNIMSFRLLDVAMLGDFVSEDAGKAGVYMYYGFLYIVALLALTVCIVIAVITMTGTLVWIGFIFIAWDYYGSLIKAIPAGIFWPFALIYNLMSKKKTTMEAYSD